MTNKRFNKFNKEFASVLKTDIFNKIRDLYVDGIIKSIPSANKLLQKIKYTKKNVLYKTSVKTANVVTEQYNKFVAPKILINNQLNQRTIENIDINKINTDGLGTWIHRKEILELKKGLSSGYIIQIAKFYTNTGYSHSRQLRIPVNIKGKKMWERICHTFNEGDSDGEWKIRLWVEDNKKNYASITTTLYNKNEQIKNIDIKQVYKASESETCVYDGFLNFFDSKERNKRTIYNKLIANKDKYAKAYTDETLQEICDFTETTLIIKDLVRGEHFNKVINCNIKPKWTINFLNTKFNHLDLLKHNYSDVIELDTKIDYEKIRDESEFYIETMGQLITTDKTYKVKDDDFKVVYKKWKEDNNYNDLQIKEDSDEMKLINGYDYSMHHFINDFEIDNTLYDELDIEKAYFNYCNKNKNSNYIGVPSGDFMNLKCEDTFTIETFNKQYDNKLIGFYQVYIQQINNHIEVFNKINIKLNNTYVFTSVQIKEFSKFLTFKFLNISIAPSTHIPFTENFKGKIEKTSYYCKAVGLMMVESDMISITVKPLVCDLKYYQIINNETYDTYENNGIIKIHDKKKEIKSCHHIAYFIHSYIKVLIFQQLLQVNINDVFGIKLDSIVIKKNASIKKIINGFYDKFKECKIEKMLNRNNKKFNNITLKQTWVNAYEDEDENEYVGYTLDELKQMLSITNINNENKAFYEPYYKPCSTNKQKNNEWHISELDGHSIYGNIEHIDNDEETTINYEINFKRSFLPNYEMITNRLLFLGGKGGSGKTYSVLTHEQDLCFVSMCWNLSEAKKVEYPNIRPLSINRLVGDHCEQEKIYNKVIFDDEMTMMREDHLKKCINDNPRKWIIMAGDIDEDGTYYQCNVKNNVVNPSKLNCQYVKYTTNYRFDNELNNILDNMRLIRNKKELMDFIAKHFTFKNKEDIIFDDKCIGISDLDDTKNDDELTNFFIEKGASPRYFIKETNYKKGQYRGAKVDDITLHNNYEMKLFKTVHSYQGLDITKDEKLIISIEKYDDYNFWYLFRLMYTALSRARRLDQIIILKN